ncbi:MAG: pantoate--beta-alanine ligase [Pseudomonadota bacterium]
MQVVNTIAELRRLLGGQQDLGFVPTMGALHAGHAALIRRAATENSVTVVSVYVNPTQFDNPTDLGNYPQTLDQDARVAGAEGADLLFVPSFAEIYPDGFRYQVEETIDSRVLCGAHRPGHFTGVLTVVMKLLNIVRAKRAYFGQKDYQQLHLIKGMAQAFFLETEIVGCPTVRESDGLALSSRNLNLNEADRLLAPLLHRLIDSEESDQQVIEALADAGFRVDYVESRWGRRFAAARLGPTEKEVRLIDNVPHKLRSGA